MASERTFPKLFFRHYGLAGIRETRPFVYSFGGERTDGRAGNEWFGGGARAGSIQAGGRRRTAQSRHTGKNHIFHTYVSIGYSAVTAAVTAVTAVTASGVSVTAAFTAPFIYYSRYCPTKFIVIVTSFVPRPGRSAMYAYAHTHAHARTRSRSDT